MREFVITEEILRKEYIENFKSINQISKEYSVCEDSIRRALKRYSISHISKKEREDHTKLEYQKRLPKELYEEEYKASTIEQISQKYQIPLWYTIKLRELYGIRKNNITYQHEKRESVKELTYEFLYDQYIKQNKSITLISKETKHSMKSISNKLKEYNIDLKNKNEIIKNTLLTKYGVSNPIQIPEAFNKMIETNITKYGVPYGIFTENCLNSGSTKNSGPNNFFEKKLLEQKISFTREYKIENKLFDFKIGNILIEIDPFPTHNSTWGYKQKNPLDKNYHRDKSLLAEKNRFRCIHVFDWDDNEKIIDILKNKTVLYARKCFIKEVPIEDASAFLANNHLQGTCTGMKQIIGLYNKDELVELMVFGKPRYNTKYEYELLRLCTSNKYNIVGGTKKLFSYFIKHYDPQSIISYCDNSKFTGQVYGDLGFSKIRNNQPSKHWFNIHGNPMHITDNLIRQLGYDKIFKTNYGKNTNNEELLKNSGYVEIYDCGQSTFVYKK